MSQHNHKTYVQGCFRCDLSRDEATEVWAETLDETLLAMAAEVAVVNTANGWYEDERTFGDDIALLHSEASEMLEAFRDHGYEDVTRDIDVPCPDPQCGDSTWGHECELGSTRPGKPEGVGSEAADVLIRLLDTCHRRGIDLGAEYRRKIAFNRTRDHRHGGKSL